MLRRRHSRLRRAPASAGGAAQATAIRFGGSDYLRQFQWTTGLPAQYPLTLFWRCFVRDAGQKYQTFFFYGTRDNFFSQTTQYYGACPFPYGLGAGSPPPATGVRYYEIPIDGGDEINGASATPVVYGEWKDMAFVAEDIGATRRHTFYFDLSDLSKKIVVDKSDAYFTSLPTNPCIVFGGAPWNHITSDADDEEIDADFRKIGIWTEAKSGAALQAQAATDTFDTSSLWYAKLNPAHDDLVKDSGAGGSPSWRDAGHQGTTVNT